MSGAVDGADPLRPAWQPFTFGGLAAFARARLGRLLLAELLAALVSGGCVVFFLQWAYVPIIAQTIQKMPETARISRGHLVGIGAPIITESKLLAIAFTPETSEPIGQSADVQVQFRFSNFRIGTVFRPDWGWESDYWPGALELSRSNLEPWWGAWHPVLLTLAGLITIVLLFGIWALLAAIYTLLAKFMAWYGDRQLLWGGAWCLCSAALLPGAILMCLAILLYAWQVADLVGFAFLLVAHFVVGWVYVVGGALACPREFLNPIKHNPFVS